MRMLFGKAEIPARVTAGEPPTESSRKRGRLASAARPASVIELHPSNDSSSSELIWLNISRLRLVICV